MKKNMKNEKWELPTDKEGRDLNLSSFQLGYDGFIKRDDTVRLATYLSSIYIMLFVQVNSNDGFMRILWNNNESKLCFSTVFFRLVSTVVLKIIYIIVMKIRSKVPRKL